VGKTPGLYKSFVLGWSMQKENPAINLTIYRWILVRSWELESQAL